MEDERRDGDLVGGRMKTEDFGSRPPGFPFRCRYSEAVQMLVRLLRAATSKPPARLANPGAGEAPTVPTPFSFGT